jgi:hypothetical protein
VAFVSATDATNELLLSNSHIPLLAGVKYRVSFLMKVIGASSAHGLRVSFRSQGAEDVGFDVPTTVGSSWQPVSFSVDTVHSSPMLAFLVSGRVNVELASLSIILDGDPLPPSPPEFVDAGAGPLPVRAAVMDFDSADKRNTWRNDNTGGRALSLPDGEGGGITWAALALPTPTQSPETDWPLSNRQLALVPGTTYRICADLRSQAPLSATDRANRVLRVMASGIELVRRSYRPSTSWSQVCTASFVAKPGENNLQIGFDDPSAASGFYIDEIQILRQPCGKLEDGCGFHADCFNNVCDG